MKENTLSVLGHSISYFEVNPEKKSTVLFIHGNSMSKKLFRNQLNSERFNNYRLVFFDLVGFGGSSKSDQPTKEYNVPFYAELIRSVIQALSLDDVYLVGHSLGGHIAIEFAGRYVDEIKGFIAISTPPLGIPADIPAAFQPNPAASLLFQAQLSKEEVINLSNNVAGTIYQNEVVDSVESADPLARQKIGMSIINQNYLDEIRVLNAIKLPFALVLGEDDKLCNPGYFSKYPFKNQWRGEVNIIEHSSHNPFLDRPEEINRLILDF
ncbi:Pimeloyl-ACP methyl ester carboxylesterase, partial [Algoriphagus alkaliphilus]